MARAFDERVEYAVRQLWNAPYNGDGQKAMALLKEAAAEGDGDACYFLGRCYLGSCFINPVFGFEENEDLGIEYFQKSLELGSAVGMFATMRLSGFKPRTGSFVNPPYHSMREIWDAVEELAKNGQGFCQYLIANAYYFGDVIKLWEIPKVEPKDLYGFTMLAMDMYDQCIANGIAMGIGNYIDIVTSGDYGIPVQEEKARQLRHIGADMQVGLYERIVGDEYFPTEAIKAVEMYERAISHGDKEAYGHLGKLYFYGGNGVAQDYNKAVQYFTEARKYSDWCSDLLGTCYLKGLGTPVNYAAAKNEFEIYTGEYLSAVGLGEIYAYGLGVPVDIKRGMEYWNNFPNDPRVVENKRNFKKTLFGWKARN